MARKKKVKYGVRSGFRVRKADAQAIGEVLEKLKPKNGPILTDDVIAHARKKSSPLHRYFQWDIDGAALAHWRETAGKLIRSVVVIRKDSPPVRFMAHISMAEEPGYYVIDDLDAETMRVVEQRALKELAAWFKRYAEFARRAGVYGFVQKAIRMLRKQTTESSTRAS